MPDHELCLAVDAKGRVGGLPYQGERVWFSQGLPGNRGEVFYLYMGNDTDFPHDSEVPIELLRQAAKEFLQRSGERPTCVSWQTETGT